MTHRVGIIGLGTVGSRFVEQFNLHDDFELVAAWDPDAVACSRHADQAAIVPHADAVIAASDVVYIAVPPLFHRDYVERCVAGRVAIFCEKPLGIDLTESRTLVDLVESSGLAAGVNFVFSAAPAATALVDITAGGELGDIAHSDLRLHFAEWPRAWHAKAQWLRLRDQGGWAREVLSHFLFLAQRALGPLSLDYASVTFPDGPDGELCETDAIARFSSRNGPVVLMGTVGGAGADVVDFTVRGTHRAVRLWDWYRLQEADDGVWSDLLGNNRVELGADAYAGQLGELDALVAGRPSQLATFREALEVQELVEAVLAAH